MDDEYAKWYLSTPPKKPVDVKEATRYWLDRLLPAPRSYEEFLQTRAGNGGNYKDGGSDYISAPGDTWGNGSLYRMHMVRKQTVIDLTHTPDDGIFIPDQIIDD